MEARNFGDPPCKRSPSLSLVWLEADCDGYLTSLPAATISANQNQTFLCEKYFAVGEQTIREHFAT